MSIEQSLERIAVALETITANVPVIGVATDAAPKEKKAKKETALPAEDILSDAPTYTQDEVHKSLRAYMDKNGIDKTKALMIKFGASAVKPVLTSIPVANYAALMKEIGG